LRELLSILLQPRQPLPGILDFGLAGGGVFLEVEEFAVILDRPYFIAGLRGNLEHNLNGFMFFLKNFCRPYLSLLFF
jgi:hypothetical protein